MKIQNNRSVHRHLAMIVVFVLMSGQRSTAQSYFNLNFVNSTNKYSLITEVKSITFNESGGIVVKKTDNSIGTETLNLIKSITLDGTDGGGTPLPVELVSFTAASASGITTLKWTTAVEVNNYGFEIERQLSNYQTTHSQNSLWGKAGFVEGSGTINVPKEYSYTDKNIRPGKYSYRLKQIDREGKFEYSQQVEVTVTGAPKEFALEQNYPNPFNPTTAIGFQLSARGTTTLKVYDAIGREVATLVNEVKEAGTYAATFDGSKLSSGIYYATLENGGNKQLIKMQMLK